MSLKKELEKLANPEKSIIYQRFFKTGKGQYAEGDVFLGLTMPQTRAIVKNHKHIEINELKDNLSSKFHEERLAALLILVEKFKTAEKESDKKQIFDFYIENAKSINNWDLVDSSADKIVGKFLQNKDRSLLYELVKSANLWERRISIISTFHFIRLNDFADTLKISEILLKDSHDLIHKAVGWMLREVGKRDLEVLENFLKKHYRIMPRTMLRYAIEKFPEEKRQSYLLGKI